MSLVCVKLYAQQIPSETNVADSLSRSLDTRLDSATARLNTRIDNLKDREMPGEAYVYKVDSLYRSYQNEVASLKEKYSGIDQKLDKKFESVDSLIQTRTYRLDSLLKSNGLEGLGSSLDIADKYNARLPELPNLHPQVPAMEKPAINLNVPAAPALPDVQDPVAGINPNVDLKALNENLQQGEQLSGQAAQLKQGDLTQTDKAIEDLALKTDEMKVLADESGKVEKLKKEIGSLKEAVSADKARQKANEKLVDHFAGKEDLVKKDLDDIAKIQMRYRNVTDSRHLPKRGFDDLHGKPFLDRLVAGSSFQVNQSDPKRTGIDVSPYVGYKFSSRFRTSIGGTCRVLFDAKAFELRRNGKSYAVRSFTNYKFLKETFAHLELEFNKSRIPEYHAQRIGSSDPGRPRWIPMAYAGIFRTYSLGRRISGQAQVLYDFLNVRENFHFNKIAVRFGAEYQFKSRPRKKK